MKHFESKKVGSHERDNGNEMGKARDITGHALWYIIAEDKNSS